MGVFKRKWYKLLISLILAYCLVACFFPQIFAFNNADDCLLQSSLLEKLPCFLQDGFEFIKAPFKLLSLGGINLAFGLVWYPVALMIYILAVVCTYSCFFVIIPCVTKKLKKQNTHQKV